MTVADSEHDRVLTELAETRKELADTRLMIAAIVVSNGGEVRVPRRVLVAINLDTRIESHVEPVSSEYVYRVQM